MIEVFQHELTTKPRPDRKKAYKPATVNRMLALMKGIYNLAIREEMVERNPCFKVTMLPENNKRDRVMTGHKTTIFDRYNTVDSGDARFAMDRYEGWLRNQITSGLLHALPNAKKKGRPNGQAPYFPGAGGRNRTDMPARGGGF
jgi:hypothetical protein